MRVTLWTQAAALALLVYFKDAVVFAESGKCVEPSVVNVLETKISDLQQSNAALQLQVDSLSAEKSKALTKIANEHEEVVLKLKGEIASLKKEVKKLENDVANEKKIVEKKESELKTALDKLSEETARASSRESTIGKLEENLAKERAMVAEADAELKAALSKLAEKAKEAAQLEKSYLVSEKKNKALMNELGAAKSMELTLATLLSQYYDDALVLVEQTLNFAQEKVNEQSSTFEQVQTKFEDAKKSARDKTNKFYQENLATTLDPIVFNVRNKVDPMLEDMHKAVSPHLNKHLPVLNRIVAKAKELVVMFLQEALRRGKLARIDAIILLEQNKHVGLHAQKIVDGVLIILAVPLFLFQIRLVLRVAWWVFTTTLWLFTCGMCCGHKRNSKLRRKSSKKTSSVNASLNIPLNGPTQKTAASKTVSTSQKRSKKGKN